MTYPGNATLTREMQERILSTFQQTLSAAAAGNRQEATLGCDFILRLDSLFGPARQLLERLETGEGPVETEDLAAAVGMEVEQPPISQETVEAAAQPPDIDDLSDLDLEMGLSDPKPPVEAPATEPQAAAPPPPPEAAPPPPPEPPPPTPEPQSAAAVDPLADLDLGLDEPSEEAPEPAAAPPPEPPPAEPAPEPPPAEPAATPAEAPALDAPLLDELDDLDLTVDSPAEPSGATEPPSPKGSPRVEPPEEAVGEESLAPPPAQATEPTQPPPAADVPEAPADDAPAPEPERPAPAAPAPEPEPPTAEAPAAAEPETSAADAPAQEPEETSADAEPEAPADEPAKAPPPESVEIPLDAEPAAQLDAESQQRIDDLLAEGQEAFDGGEYQGAIDAWSRIFLIDIDHAEANKRIEEARKLKAEADRKVEEKFHEGLSHLESGELEAATETFRAVLEMQPSHLQAQDYLEKLEAGEVPVPAELAKPAEAEPAEADADLADMELAEADEEPEAKPDRGTKAVGDRVVTVRKSPFKSKSFMAIAAAGLIAVLGGAWYLFNNWSSLFPNSGQEAPVRAAPSPVERAKGLHEQGKTPIAIAQLRRLPPGSPQYDEAQALIAQWELEQAPADQGPAGPSPGELARREALVAEASDAADQREFMRASELLSEAAAVAPLSGAEVQLLARADEQLQELQNFITLFREGEWDMALRDLWLLHESDPGNADVTRLLVDSYYNLGLRALQRRDIKVAEEQFKEGLGLSPDDPELQRLADFAATYQTRSPDLLYRIYVKYHPFR